MRNEDTIRFVREHRNEDVRSLALRSRRDGDIDLRWALDQIQGWQTARRKLPTWSATDGIIYPPHLSMEQCSSEATAIYKCGIVNRLPKEYRKTLIDLTGGFGVDFAFMAQRFDNACYVEMLQHLCETARHNFEQLGLDHVQVIHSDAEEYLRNTTTNPASTLLYLDPARRDSNSSRTYAIADCTPNVLELLPDMFKAAHHVLLKLSPMLDWHKAVSDLGSHVAEVHIVSTANECKELLVILKAVYEGEPTIYCMNDDQHLTFMPSEENASIAIAASVDAAYLYEPNASVMKAGCYGILTGRYPVKALAANSHLFVSSDEVKNFPGRCFIVTAVMRMNKKELTSALKGITHANVTVRNFPMTAQDLRKRLRLADGGDNYIFGTTTDDGRHLLYLCKRAQ